MCELWYLGRFEIESQGSLVCIVSFQPFQYYKTLQFPKITTNLAQMYTWIQG